MYKCVQISENNLKLKRALRRNGLVTTFLKPNVKISLKTLYANKIIEE